MSEKETEDIKRMNYEKFSPLLKNLYQNKVVYHEHSTSIVRLDYIKISPDFFEAIATRHLLIKLSRANKRRPNLKIPDEWEIGASWAYMNYNGLCFSSYSGWLMWTKPELVERVEKLVMEYKFDEAYEITMGENY